MPFIWTAETKGRHKYSQYIPSFSSFHLACTRGNIEIHQSSTEWYNISMVFVLSKWTPGARLTKVSWFHDDVVTWKRFRITGPLCRVSTGLHIVSSFHRSFMSQWVCHDRQIVSHYWSFVGKIHRSRCYEQRLAEPMDDIRLCFHLSVFSLKNQLDKWKAEHNSVCNKW